MSENKDRKPKSYRDEFQTLRYKWEDATPEDIYAIQDMMYNQARRQDESIDGKAWSKLFVGNGAFKMSKPAMTLFQEKYNVHYSYSAMRDFLRSEFGIESPLPRHEKVDFPYEDHPDNVMKDLVNQVVKESVTPESLGLDYDVDNPDNARAIQEAIDQFDAELESIDTEKMFAEQLEATAKDNIDAINDLIAKDIKFEEACNKLNIDPVMYGKMHYELRDGGPAMSFEDAIAQLNSFDVAILERYKVRKENEEKGIFSDESISSILRAPEELGAGNVNEDIRQYGNEESPQEPKTMDMNDHIRRTEEKSAGAGAPGGESSVNEYMRQIKQQELDKSAAKPGYDPKANNEKLAQGAKNAGPMYPMMGFHFRMPFEDRIAAMIGGAVSYPGSKYRNFRDAVTSKKRVAESRNSLLREIHSAHENFGDMSPDQKLNTVKRISDTVNDYLGDIKDASEVAMQNNDVGLKKFLKNEHDGPSELIKNLMGKCAEKHKELDELKKHIDKSIDAIKKIIRQLLSVIFGRKGNEAESPSPSP